MRKLLSLFVLSLLTLASSYGQAISPYLAGQNAWLPTGYGGAVYNGQLDVLWPIVQKSKVQMIRIGGNGVEFNMPSGDEYVTLIDSIRRIGAEPMVQVSEGRGKYTAERAAGIVDYVNNVKKRNIKYWIIGNEPNLVGTHPTVNAEGVAAYHKAWATAMKLMDPSILIVGPECAFYDSNYYPALVGGVHDITGKDANGNYYVDIVSFHTYPFNGTQTRDQVLTSAQSFAGNVDRLIALMSAADAKHGRTGAQSLRWALTEFNINFRNPTNNTVEGVGVHSFLNGQYWAEVFGVGMQKGAVSIQPWSIHESSGSRVPLDLGYLDGIGATIKPRSSYYHEMLIAGNMRGNYLAATDNQTNITAFGSVFNDTTSIMLLNKSLSTTFDFTLQLSDKAITNASPLKVNLLAGIDAAYSDKISGQSTLVLLFDKQGKLLKKIVYSLQQAAKDLPPSTLAPGEELTLVSFAADKTLTCVTAEEVTFTASVLGSYDELLWDFGAGATPQTATGPGPVKVTYSTLGGKNVTLTLKSGTKPDVVERKDNYVQVRSCVRTPFLSAPVALPGLIKAVEFDKGGQDVAYNDSDVANQGALRDPTVPRSDESVDTENSGNGLGNIGYTADGEWMRYSVAIQKSGTYKITARIASLNGGGSLRILVNGVDKTGIVPVPKTAGFGDYQDLVINNVYLEASPNATLQVEVVKSGFNMASFAFAEGNIDGIVVNRVYNATSTPDGMSDAVELLVTKDNLDIRGLIIKDFETNLTADSGGKYQFNNNPLWTNLRIGTTIVLRRLDAGIAGYTEDLNPADSKLDLLFENTTYLTNVAVSGHRFNLTNTDMVLLKTGSPDGVANAVHAFATNNGGGTTFFTGVTSPKLFSTMVLGTGAFHYPLNPEKSVADYNGAKAANSIDANRNWGNGYGENNIAYISSLRASIVVPEPVAASIVVNRVYNGSNDGTGERDATELLVIKDNLDIRNLIVKDFDANITNDNGGKYRFNSIPFWQNLRAGTTIVLRKISGGAGYVQDTDPSDFTLDLLLENAEYITNVSSGNVFNITQTDMVMIKTGEPTGVAGAIHAFATRGGGANGVPSAIYQSVSSPKLVSPNEDAGGDPSSFHYPLNPDQQPSDYAGAKGAISKSTERNWGFGFGPGNVAYIQSLRSSGFAAPSGLTTTAAANAITLAWTDNTSSETGFEVARSLDGTTYTLLATVAANTTTYTDACLRFNTAYTYQVRAKSATAFSAYSAAVNARTEARPTVSLPTITGECSATLLPPSAPDNCGGTVAGTTTDPLTYTAQGTYTVTWSFDGGSGDLFTATQTVVVKDETKPTVLTRNISVTLANGAATITAAAIDNGSTDACGIRSVALDKTTFDCSNLGENMVILTVTDVNGNTASASAIVTVVGVKPEPAIAISRTDNTFTGLDANTIALGYGAQSLTLTASSSTSAGAATTYAWSPAAGLSDANSANPVFTPTTAGTYTFTVKATNEFGCEASASVTVTVLDVRCGDGKVAVCRNGNSQCISPNAVPAHLKQDKAQLGACSPLSAQASPDSRLGGNSGGDQAGGFEAYPNPFETRAVVRFRPAATAATQVQVYNSLGQLAATLYNATAEAGRSYEVTLDGTGMTAGVYTVRLISNGKVQTKRVVLVK